MSPGWRRQTAGAQHNNLDKHSTEEHWGHFFRLVTKPSAPRLSSAHWRQSLPFFTLWVVISTVWGTFYLIFKATASCLSLTSVCFILFCSGVKTGTRLVWGMKSGSRVKNASRFGFAVGAAELHKQTFGGKQWHLFCFQLVSKCNKKKGFLLLAGCSQPFELVRKIRFGPFGRQVREAPASIVLCVRFLFQDFEGEKRENKSHDSTVVGTPDWKKMWKILFKWLSLYLLILTTQDFLFSCTFFFRGAQDIKTTEQR